MVERTVRVILQGDATSLVNAATQARNALNQLGNTDVTPAGEGVRRAGGAATEATSAFQKFKDSMAAQVSVGNLMSQALQSAMGAVGTAISTTISSGVEYQTTLFTMGAVSHATADQMEQVAAKSRELGKDMSIPNASATDAAKAMTELAKGGLSVGSSMEAAKGTLLLAAAATVSASQAAEIEVNTLNAYGLAADQAGRVSDVLANAANQASGEMTDFAEGLKMVGSTAHGFGISLEDTTTVLGLFANAGIKAEMGGTLLNTMLLRLAAPTKPAAAAMKELGITTFDASGNFEGMRAVTDQLRAAHDKLTPAVYDANTAIVFGTRGIRGAMILGQETASAYGLMSDALTHQGGAAELASAKMAGLGGAFQGVSNVVQDLQLEIFGGLAPALTVATNGFGAVVGAAGNALTWFTSLPLPISGISTALGGVLLLSGPLNAFWLMLKTNVIAAVETMRIQMMIASDTLRGFELSMAGVRAAAVGLWTALGGPVGIAILAVTTALSFMAGGTSDATVATSDFTDAIDRNTGALSGNSAVAIAKSVADSGSVDKYVAIGGSVQDYTAALVGNSDAQDRVHTTIQKAAESAVVQDGAFKATGMTVQEYATSVLASGMASNMSNDAMHAAGAASQAFAHDSDTLTTEQNKVKEAIAGAGGAADGGAASQTSLNAAITAGADPAATMVAAMKDFKTQADFATTAGNYLWATLQDLSGNTVDAEHQMRLLDATFRAMVSSATAVADANTNIGNTADRVATAQAKLDELTAHLGGTMNGQAVSSSNLAVTQAQVDQAARDLTTAQNASAGSSDKVKAAQDAQADSTDKAAMAVIDAAGRAYALKYATNDLSGAVQDATAATADGRQKFVDAEAQINGGNIPAAEALADKYHLIPSEVVTAIQASGLPQAQKQVDDLNASLNNIKDKTYHYTIVQDQVTAVNPSNVPLFTALTAPATGGAHAEGGWITGSGGPKDDKVKARLSPHEFVVNAAQALKHGALLEAINNGTMGFAAGGTVPDAAATTPVAATAAVAASAVALPDVAAFQTAWLAIAKAVQDAWTVTINPTLLLLAAGEATTATEFLSLEKDAVEPSWAANSTAITTSVDAIILPTYDALNLGTNNVAMTVANAANAWIIPTVGNMAGYISNQVFNAIIPTYDAWNNGTANLAAVQVWLRDQMIIPVWDGILREISDVWAHFQGVTFPQFTQGLADLGSANQQLQSNTESTWSAIGSTISNTFNGQIVPAWNGVQNFTNAMGSFFSGIESGMNAAASTTNTDLSSIQTAIDSFFAMIDAKAPAAAAAPAATPALADGGMITSGTGPRADDVTVRVSKGEYVVNAAATQKHKSTLDQINYGYADGGIIPGFADGGLIGDKIGNRVENAVVGGVERAFGAGVTRILASVAATISAYTPGSVAGARGAFLDAVSSKMGTSYEWGAAGPDVFDCSGLMSWALEQAGVGVGRLTAEQFNAGYPHIPEGSVVPGDLVTFDTGRLPGQAGHIGAVFDIARHLMMNTDGSGPAGVADYQNRDGGPLSFLDPIGGSYVQNQSPTTGAGDPPEGGWLGKVLAQIKRGGTGAAAPSLTPANGPVGAGVEQWRSVALTALGVAGQSPAWIDDLLAQMNQESSGNPNAINLTDVNAQRGTPSEGLMQVIWPTFESVLTAHGFGAWAQPKNLMEPMANILASVLYTADKFGDLGYWRRNGFGPYDDGGMWPSGTGGVNLTGHKEAVLAPAETKAYKTHAAALAAGYGGKVLPPQASHFAPVVNVAAPNVTVYLDDFSANVRVEVDGALANAARVLTRSGGQG